MTKTKTKGYCVAAAFLVLCAGVWLVKQARAEDDFGNIVHHIETEYHVHSSHGLVLALAGMMVKCSHIAGAKDFKAAVFEDQHLAGPDGDARLDEIVQSAGKSGWHPLVRSFSRRSGEHSYIYAQGGTKDLKLLIVSVEPNEAVVMQVRIDADKPSDFLNEHAKPSAEGKDWE